jgi:hypothetical protein
MSSTRHAAIDAPLNQEKYLSSPEFAEFRGINGIAVSAKARLILNARARSLLWFIQSRSLEEGGLKRVAAELVEMFPDRIGTQTLQALRSRGVRSLSFDETSKELSGMCWGSAERKIVWSRFPEWEERFEIPTDERRCDGFAEERFDRLQRKGKEAGKPHTPLTDLFGVCREVAEVCLPDFLVDLCINPKTLIVPSEESGLDEMEDDTQAAVPWFSDILPSLFEWQKRCIENVHAGFVMTDVARQVFATLDVALETGRIVVIQGREGVGKSEAIKAWTRMHAGQCRLISLSGVMEKTGFFREISRALGLASSYTQKALDMRARVEDVLKRSRLLLVIDEAHYLFDQARRITKQPELINWIYTSLTNSGVGCALVTTEQFSERMRSVQKQVAWNAGQFIRRVRAFTRLPDRPTPEDLEGVTRKRWPELESATVKLLVANAFASPRPMPFLVDTIDDAHRIAARAGRQAVVFADVKKAITELRLPSDQAMIDAFSPEVPTRIKKQRAGSASAPALQSPDSAPPAAGVPPKDSFPVGRVAARRETCGRAAARSESPSVLTRLDERSTTPCT